MSQKLLFTYLLIIAAGLVLSTGCGQTEEPELASSIDLISLWQGAIIDHDSTELPTTTTLTNRYFGKGFLKSRPKMILVSDKEAHLYFDVLELFDRTVYFDIKSNGPYGEIADQRMDVTLNGNLIASSAIPEEYGERLGYALPTSQLKRGRNEIVLQFANSIPNPRFPAPNSEALPGSRFGFPTLAAYISEVGILPAAVPYQDFQNVMFSSKQNGNVVRAPNGKALQQTPNSVITYAVRPESSTVLKINGRLEGELAADEEVTISVNYLLDDSSEATVLSVKKLTRSTDKELQAELELPVTATNATAVQLSVISTNFISEAAMIWSELSLNLVPPAVLTPEPVAEKASFKAPKNVIIIVTDATNKSYLGTYGNKENLSPNIDKFANESIQFNTANSPSASTQKSVATLFTGLFADAHGAYKLSLDLSEEFRTFPAAFNEAGFETLALGGNKFVTDTFNLTKDFSVNQRIRPEEGKAKVNSEMDIELIKSEIERVGKQDKPVLAYIHLLPPHWPYMPPESFMNGKKSAITEKEKFRLVGLSAAAYIDEEEPRVQPLIEAYKDNIRFADWLVGEILTSLKENNLYDNSIIIYTADHGESFALHQELGHSKTSFEDMVAVPLIIHIPGFAPGQRTPRVSWVDFYPTFANLYFPDEDVSGLDGRDISSLIMEDNAEENCRYFVRIFDEDTIAYAVYEGNYKFMYDGFEPYGLYDLASDPQEQNNIFGQLPVKAAHLQMHGYLTVQNGINSRKGKSSSSNINDDDLEELENLGYVN